MLQFQVLHEADKANFSKKPRVLFTSKFDIVRIHRTNSGRQFTNRIYRHFKLAVRHGFDEFGKSSALSQTLLDGLQQHAASACRAGLGWAGLGMNGKHRTWGQYNCNTHTFDKTASVQTLMKWQSGNQARSCRNTLPSERQGLPSQTGRKTERHPVRCLSSGINQPT